MILRIVESNSKINPSLRDFALAKSWQSILFFICRADFIVVDCFGDSLKSPCNDGKVERLYFWQKPKVAKTFNKDSTHAVILRALARSIYFGDL